jgi:hypothetical protein
MISLSSEPFSQCDFRLSNGLWSHFGVNRINYPYMNTTTGMVEPLFGRNKRRFSMLAVRRWNLLIFPIFRPGVDSPYAIFGLPLAEFNLAHWLGEVFVLAFSESVSFDGRRFARSQHWHSINGKSEQPRVPSSFWNSLTNSEHRAPETMSTELTDGHLRRRPASSGNHPCGEFIVSGGVEVGGSTQRVSFRTDRFKSLMSIRRKSST